MSKAAVILAAGSGTRMKSALPKVLHQVAGLPMLGHVIAALRGAGVEQIVVVTAPDAHDVRAYAESQRAQCAIQDRQLGTGHAAAAAAPALKDFRGALLIAYGDMPLVTAQTYKDAFSAAGSAMALVAFRPDDAAAYGRVLLDAKGMVERIVEYKDASEAERKTTLCNAGMLVADAQNFFTLAARLDNKNAQGEFYLTDIPALARKQNIACAMLEMNEIEAMGVNSRSELAAAESHMQQRLRAAALNSGVGMTAPETVFLCHDTMLAADVTVEPFVVFGPGVSAASGARIRSHSHLEGAAIGQGAIIGPFARLRPGTVIGAHAHVGNFVEVKNTNMADGAKANHLTYLGDADVGAKANIGAGTITCNYDGFTKSRTEIGAGAFIGSDTALVAPVRVGAGAITAAGSVITRDVAADALGVARGEQVEKPGWAKAFRLRKTKEKN